jgi:hypothetical protein
MRQCHGLDVVGLGSIVTQDNTQPTVLSTGLPMFLETWFEIQTQEIPDQSF